MAGTYGTIVAAQGYLEGYSALVAARQTASEAEGDRLIDDKLARWDRSGWGSGSGDSSGPPPTIARAWQIWAEAEYILRDHMKTNPGAGAEDRVASVEHMREEALRILDDIVQRGYVLNQAGEEVYPAGGKSGASRFTAEIER